MKILLTSLAARGHAIADALARSPQRPEIISIVPSRNPGIEKIASEMFVADLMDFDSVLEIAKKVEPDFAFVAPDDPIGAGLVDALEELGIRSVAPKNLKLPFMIVFTKSPWVRGFRRNRVFSRAANPSAIVII